MQVATPIAQWLGSSNSCINPILYAFFNKKYRRGFAAIIRSRSCCGRLRCDIFDLSIKLIYCKYHMYTDTTITWPLHHQRRAPANRHTITIANHHTVRPSSPKQCPTFTIRTRTTHQSYPNPTQTSLSRTAICPARCYSNRTVVCPVSSC